MEGPAIDIFAPEFADTVYRLDNVHRLAARLGKLFGIEGPYVLKFTKPTLSTWTFEIDNKPYTIDVATYAGIVNGSIRAGWLADQMLIDRGVALKLCQLVTHLERTASVRAMAMQMEWERVRRAMALEARRQQIRDQGGAPPDPHAEAAGTPGTPGTPGGPQAPKAPKASGKSARR